MASRAGRRETVGGVADASKGFVVRESGRARHVRLVMTLHDGLVVVVPRGFDQREIPEILERKHLWIERASARVAARRAEWMTDTGPTLPDRLELRCLGSTWRVQYESFPLWGGGGGSGTFRREMPERGTAARTVIREGADRLLVVRGDVDDEVACRAALRRWLMRKVRSTIVPRLGVLAYERGFTIGAASVRAQRTRWASCSPQQNISLNVKLLFLPPELVDHVLLHELCHTVRPDHSRAFWALLEQHDPDWKSRKKRLWEAHRYVPLWFGMDDVRLG